MKKQNVRFVLVLSLVLVAGSAFAQTINVHSNVPFSFMAGGKSMPAGEYIVKSATLDGKTLLLLGAADTRTLVNTNSAESRSASDSTKLVFHMYDGQYFLSEVWVSGNNLGHQIPVSARESELSKLRPPVEVSIIADGR